jgi:hypothetical protein
VISHFSRLIAQPRTQSPSPAKAENSGKASTASQTNPFHPWRGSYHLHHGRDNYLYPPSDNWTWKAETRAQGQAKKRKLIGRIDCMMCLLVKSEGEMTDRRTMTNLLPVLGRWFPLESLWLVSSSSIITVTTVVFLVFRGVILVVWFGYCSSYTDVAIMRPHFVRRLWLNIPFQATRRHPLSLQTTSGITDVNQKPLQSWLNKGFHMITSPVRAVIVTSPML